MARHSDETAAGSTDFAVAFKPVTLGLAVALLALASACWNPPRISTVEEGAALCVPNIRTP